ncbi:MAG: hypothetical protein WKF61_05760 [Luteimonas sp.]
MSEVQFYSFRNACMKAQQDADEVKGRIYVIERADHTHSAEGVEVFEVVPKSDISLADLADEDDIRAAFIPRDECNDAWTSSGLSP